MHLHEVVATIPRIEKRTQIPSTWLSTSPSAFADPTRSDSHLSGETVKLDDLGIDLETPIASQHHSSVTSGSMSSSWSGRGTSVSVPRTRLP